MADPIQGVVERWQAFNAHRLEDCRNCSRRTRPSKASGLRW